MKRNKMKWHEMKWNKMKWNGMKWDAITWNGMERRELKWNEMKMTWHEMKCNKRQKHEMEGRATNETKRNDATQDDAHETTLIEATQNDIKGENAPCNENKWNEMIRNENKMTWQAKRRKVVKRNDIMWNGTNYVERRKVNRKKQTTTQQKTPGVTSPGNSAEAADYAFIDPTSPQPWVEATASVKELNAVVEVMPFQAQSVVWAALSHRFRCQLCVAV